LFRQPVVLLQQREVQAQRFAAVGMTVLVMMIMVMSMVVGMFMPVIVGMAADFHIAAAETASAFFAHKILFCSGGL
jgi:hypothetical protein